ncbi:hypothetical protein GCM10009596_01910 [Arthrobacter rhombi]
MLTPGTIRDQQRIALEGRIERIVSSTDSRLAHRGGPSATRTSAAVMANIVEHAEAYGCFDSRGTVVDDLVIKEIRRRKKAGTGHQPRALTDEEAQVYMKRVLA